MNGFAICDLRLTPRWNIAPRLPGFLAGRPPAVTSDSTYGTRMCLVDLLSRPGNDAKSATPAMIRALHDRMGGVRMIAISFFTWGEDENARLNVMPEKEKGKLWPESVRLAQDRESGVRNNAAIELRYHAKGALNQLAPAAAANQGVPK